MEKRRNKPMIIMAVLLILTVAYISLGFYGNYENARLSGAYQQGFLDAQSVVNQNIINALNTQGFVTFTAPADNNETVTVRLGIIQEEAQ